MKVLILLSIAAFALAKRPCGENQYFTECGTDCPLTCDNYDNPPEICNEMCKIGCVCKKGYVETGDGRCVKPKKCPAKVNTCGENQYFTECGTDCPLTCDNYDNPPEICNYMCRIGCACKKGYVETGDGRCVKPKNCPAKVNTNAKTCVEKPDSGMCEAYIPSFYYDVETGTCKRFIYGGCQGNSNRYPTEQDCLENCRNVRPKQFSSDICDLPAESGLCDAYMPRYYFDSSRGECRQFVYGGCGGNANNFRTLKECEEACAETEEWTA